MLLRSTSTPILKSCINQAFPEPDMTSWVSVTRPNLNPPRKILRTSSESNIKAKLVISTMKRQEKPTNKDLLMQVAFSVGEERPRERGGEKESRVMEVPSVSVGGGFNGGGGRGRSFGGGGGGDGESGSENMDVYYEKMIKQFPGDPLLLANYAKFLNEVSFDKVKAQEYCERAILAKGNDGDVLSMYGDLIWKNHKDETRAQTYFDQAVQSSPNDCYVLASYAQFLWDVGEEDEDEDEDEEEEEEEEEDECAAIQRNVSMKTDSPLIAAS